MKTQTHKHKSGIVSLRLLTGIVGVCVLPILLFAAGPQWWTDRGVINPGAQPNDYAAVNQGQLKNMAEAAVAEFNAYLPGGAGDALNQLATQLSGTSAQTNDYAPVNLGQLKNVAKPFYDRLLSIGYNGHPLESGTYPWIGKETQANDYALANIGQVKNLFSFDVAQPAAPGNVTATVLEDGSVLVSWTNNAPSATGFLIQQSDDGGQTWNTVGTAAADARSCAIPAAGITYGTSRFRVSAQIPGGTVPSDGGSGGGTGDNGGTATPIKPVPVTQLAAIDISGASTDGNDVKMVTLNDNNQAAFMWQSDPTTEDPDDEGKYNTLVWKDGVFTGNVQSMDICQTVDAANGLKIHYNADHAPVPYLGGTVLTSSGGMFGSTIPEPFDIDIWVAAERYNDYTSAGFYYHWTGGTPSRLPSEWWPGFSGLGLPGPLPYYGFTSIWAGNDNGFAVTCSGVAMYYNGNVRWCDYNTLYGGAMNDKGVVVIDGGVVWSGEDYTHLPDYGDGGGCGINNQNWIIGTNTGGEGCVWKDGFDKAPNGIQDLLPKDCQKQVRNIDPYLISNADSNSGAYNIVFNADNLENSGNANGTWVNRDFLLTVSGTTTSVSVLNLPDAIGLDYLSDTFGYHSINAAGHLSALGTITTAGPNGSTSTTAKKAFLLIPVQLKDVKKESDDSDDVIVSPKATVEEKKDSSIAWIDPHGADNGEDPEMPHLVLSVPGSESLGIHIQWKLSVKYNRPRGTSPNEQKIKAQDEVYIPHTTDPQNQPWQEQVLSGTVKIYQHPDWQTELQDNGFFGGEAKLTYQLLQSDGTTPIGDEQTMLFSIGGKKLDPDLAKDYIDREAGNADSRLVRLSYAVARHESKDYNGQGSRYNEYWNGYGHRFQNDHRKGDPLWCKAPSESSAGGFGMYQITGNLSSQFAIIGRDQMWNWESNTDAYLALVKTGGSASKGSVMDRFFAAVARTYPNSSSAQNPPTSYSYNGMSLGAWEMGTITLYNGAAGCPKSLLKMPSGKRKKLTNPWTFDPSNGWQYHKNTNNYLYEVIQQH